MKKACKNCRRLTEESVCPLCNSHDLSTRWSGLVIIIDPANSEIAKKLDIKAPGEYALRVK